MNKRKWLTLATILIFLFPLLDGVFSLSIFLRETAYAESNVSTIIERDEIKVTYSYEEDSVDDSYVNWKINYQHDVTNLDSRVLSAAIKFRLVTPLAENQYLDFTGSTFMDNQDGWYRQSEFTPTSEGSFLLRSPKDVPVSLIFQMDTMNLVDRVVEKEVTVEVEKEVEIPQEEIQTAIDEANTAIAEAEETGDENQVAVAQTMAADIPTTRMEMVSETQIEEEIIQAEELAENILDSDTAKEYTLDFANYAEPEIVESTEISEASTVDSSSSETLETQTSSITEEQTSSSEAETLQTTETSVEETGNSSQEDAVASKDDDESQKESATVVPFSTSRMTRNVSEDVENPFNVQTKKRARLATKNAEGELISALDAWEQRLYEIELEITADAPTIMKGADIVFMVDASSSSNGGDRAQEVIDAVNFLAAEMAGYEDVINIALIPTSGGFNNMITEVDGGFQTLGYWMETTGTETRLQSELNVIFRNKSGNKNAILANQYVNNDLLAGRSNQAFLVYTLGTTINDPKAVGLYVNGPDSPNISKENTFVAQTAGQDQAWLTYEIVESSQYFYNNQVEGGIIKAMIDSLVSKIEIEGVALTDQVTDYFKIVRIPESVDGGPQFSKSEDGKTFGVQNITLDSSEPDENNQVYYHWETSFLVQAEADFIGGNVVPTNIVAESKVTAGDETYPFDEIYNAGTSPVTGIDTPYVNVKVFDGVVSSEETILLGETSALAETDIKNGWAMNQELLDSYRNADGTFKYDVQPSIVFGNPLALEYNADTVAPTIAGSTDYVSTGELIAGTKEGGNAAASYVSSYGTVSGGGVPVTAENTADIDGTHTLTVIDTSLTIKKLLDNDGLPANFSAIFTIARIDEEPIITPSPTNFTVNTSVSEGEFTGLGTGSYKITETLDEDLEGIKKPTELTVDITAKENTSTPSFKIMINGVEHTAETYIINNETKDLNLNILKREAGTSNPINGVVFTLTKVGETVGTDYTTQDNGNISIEPGVLVAGNSYKLVEKTPATGFLPHGTTYTITVDTLGNVSVTGGPAGNVKIDYNDDDTTVVDLTVFNNRKGVLPSTGGPGRQMFSVIALILMLSVAGISVIYVHRNRKGGA